MAFIKALIVNLAVDAVWMSLEYVQFGELQLGRECDGAVWAMYLVILTYLFWRIGD